MVDSTDQEFRAGQSVKCRILSPVPGGYCVHLEDTDIDGFLPCQEELREGSIVPAGFVCMTQGRALMTFAFRVGTTERVQMGLPSEPEMAFAVWADSHPRTFKLRRATDLVMPPADKHPVYPIQAGDYDVFQLYRDLEDGALTGCVKMENDERRSRGALLIYRGRAVGCIYGKKPMTDPYPMDTAVQMSLGDSFDPSSRLTIYDLPEEVVLSMSSMFLGCPVTPDGGAPARESLARLLKTMKEQKHTGCLTLSGDNTAELALAFVNNGQLYGVFQIDDQKFTPDFEPIDHIVKENANALAELSILPPELTTEAVLFGYGLSTTIRELQDGPPRFSATT